MQQVVRAIGELTKALTKIIREQAKMIFDALAPVKKLPELIGLQTKTLQEGIYDSVQAQILIAIAQQKGRVASLENRIKEELAQVEKIEALTRKKVEDVRATTEKPILQLDRDVQTTVHELDGPVLDLGQVTYPEVVHQPYAWEIAPRWQLSAQLGEASMQRRGRILEQDLGGIVQRVKAYRNDCERLKKQAKDLVYDGRLPDRLHLPLCAVLYEEKGKLCSRLVVAPGFDRANARLKPLYDWLQQVFTLSSQTKERQIASLMQDCGDLDFSKSRVRRLAEYGKFMRDSGRDR